MNNEFVFYRDKKGEVGFIEQILQSVVYVSGLPSVSLFEKLVFESGDIGSVISLNPEFVEVLMLTESNLEVGGQVARSGETLTIPVGDGFLGTVINPLGEVLSGKQIDAAQRRPVDTLPRGLTSRSKITQPFETGVPIVDLVVPLARGQRELVIGDRKTGKSSFLLQTAKHSVARDYVCIYAAIGKRNSDILEIKSFFDDLKISEKVIVVASTSSDVSGVIYITPYTAMTLAEYYADQGKNVLLILDDLTTHAQNYREIMLLARRFPGRNSYPGDIFYTHARLLERGGSFKKGSITCLPVAESILGDLSGYIQTNLMSITDGHIFFDPAIFNEGRRPAINPYLSVTRVGEQTQTGLVRDISRELNRFLVTYQNLKQLKHFGSEVGENAKQFLVRGEKINIFFDQPANISIPINLSSYIVALIWLDYYNDIGEEKTRALFLGLINQYSSDDLFRNNLNGLISSSPRFSDLLRNITEKNFLPGKDLPRQ